MGRDIDDSFDMFVQVGEHLFKCQKCGKLVDSGIINISDHWASCTAPTIDLRTEDKAHEEIPWNNPRHVKIASKKE